LALTALLSPLVIAASKTAIQERQREYYALMLLLQCGMTGVFCALDMLLFYVFFEFTLIPLYLIIGVWGGPERQRAANKFFLYTVAGGVLTFAGILFLAYWGYSRGDRGILTFDLPELYAISALISPEVQWWVFLALAAGFAIKVPLFPLHTWLPLAHTEAPTAGSVLLAGVLLKLGTYGFLRFALPMVPGGALAWAQVMGVLAVAGIIYGGLICWVQQDIKRLVAYSSVSHLGFCMLGMFSLHLAGLSGSVLYMINHGISTGALFLVVGMIYERYHTRDMDRLGGLARKMPVMAFFLVLFTLSSIGLPGLNGFVSEFTVLFGAFNSDVLGPGFAAFGATGILIGAIYMLYMVGKILFGPVAEPAGTPDLSAGLTRDLNRREITILAPLAALVVILGIWPTLVTRPLEPLLENQIQARLLDPSARRTAWGGKSEFRSLKSEVKSNAPGIWPFTLAELELQTPSFPLQTSRELQNSPLQNSPSFAGGAP
jgi:NADH-quinone oxidoreductase subunit M